MKRVIPEGYIITKLSDNQVFVFGSNLSGIHGAGAAKMAFENFGAKMGQGVGIQGQSYAIPTKCKKVLNTLPLFEINKYVNEFINFAKLNYDKMFLVTEIGCGLAGLRVKDVAPMFLECLTMENIYLPARFIPYLQD